MPVKPEYIKKTGNTLLEQYSGAVSVTDFEHNKQLVRQATNIHSKSVRNRVAGYITQKRRRQFVSKNTATEV